MNKSEYIVTSDGTKVWFYDDMIHREDGPAIECTNGKCGWFYAIRSLTQKNP